MRSPPWIRRHLDARKVLDYLDDRLGPAERVEVEDHLAGPCSRCRDLMHEIARTLEGMRADRAPRVPEAARARALEIFVAPSPDPASAALGWRLARLTFDSLSDPLPAGTRRSVGEARWLTFELGDHFLEIEAEPEAGDAWTLRGRLTIADPALHRIEVEAAGERRSAWPDADGNFAMERIPSGASEIRVIGPSARHRLPSLIL